MQQLHPHRAATVRLPDRQAEDVVRGAVVEGALAGEVGELEDGLRAVVVGGAVGEGGAFADAVGCGEGGGLGEGEG